MKNKHIFAYLLFGLTLSLQASCNKYALECFMKNMHQGTCPVGHQRLADHPNLPLHQFNSANKNSSVQALPKKFSTNEYNKNHTVVAYQQVLEATQNGTLKSYNNYWQRKQ
jgi:hypothetical protein